MINRYYLKIRYNRITKIYNMYNFFLLGTNVIFPAIVFLIFISLIILTYNYAYYIGDFLYWFVDLLKFKKIMKLEFITVKKYYYYLSFAIYLYIVFSLFLDLKRVLSNFLFKDFFIKNDTIFIHDFSITGSSLRSIPVNDTLSLTFRSGFLRRIFGMERLILKTGDNEYVSSPYLSSVDKKTIMKLMNK